MENRVHDDNVVCDDNDIYSDVHSDSLSRSTPIELDPLWLPIIDAYRRGPCPPFDKTLYEKQTEHMSPTSKERFLLRATAKHLSKWFKKPLPPLVTPLEVRFEFDPPTQNCSFFLTE